MSPLLTLELSEQDRKRLDAKRKIRAAKLGLSNLSIAEYLRMRIREDNTRARSDENLSE
jgi:hypothetical protein